MDAGGGDGEGAHEAVAGVEVVFCFGGEDSIWWWMVGIEAGNAPEDDFVFFGGFGEDQVTPEEDAVDEVGVYGGSDEVGVVDYAYFV